MSQKLKNQMGYIQKPIKKTCSNCSNFTSDMVKNEFGYMEEKNIRCTLGNFAVAKNANCNFHKFKN
jgi:hypothetical protein